MGSLEKYLVTLQLCLIYMFGGGSVAKSCLTLCNPMDCNLPGSSVHGILQARIQEWVVISFSICICICTYKYMSVYIFCIVYIFHFV